METKQDLPVTSGNADFSSLLIFMSLSLYCCLEPVDQLCTENEELNEYLVHCMQLKHTQGSSLRSLTIPWLPFIPLCIKVP